MYTQLHMYDKDPCLPGAVMVSVMTSMDCTVALGALLQGQPFSTGHKQYRPNGLET